MRRTLAVLLLSLVALPAAAGETLFQRVGLQLYSLRKQTAAEGAPAMLDRAKALGFKYVELAGTANLPPAEFKKLLDVRGLVPISMHFPYNRLRDEPEKVAAEARTLGLKYAGCAWAAHKSPLDEKQTREIAAVFNRAGEVLGRAGIKFFYHNHGFEFLPHGDGTLFDLLVAETKPQYVSFQMDVLWAVLPGQDPVRLIEKYPGRWLLLHLKDLRKGVATDNHSGKTDLINDVAIGAGQVNWTALLQATERAGVKYYFIEDESPSVLDQIPQSLAFLKQLKVD